jgi:hypothetical protein
VRGVIGFGGLGALLLLSTGYAKGDTERAAAELAEAQRVSSYNRYSSIAQIKAFSFGYAGRRRKSAP